MNKPRTNRFVVGALACVFLAASPAWAQLTPDQIAEMLLNSARKAHNEKNLPFANAKFREFLAKFAGHKEAAAARFGLALTLLDAVDKNFNEARELLQNVVGAKEHPDHALMVYHLALAIRGQGMQELKAAEANPGEAPARRANAQKRFEEATPHYAAALAAFQARVKEVAKEIKELPAEVEWAARARCDLAEMQLRLNKPKETQTLAAVFLKDEVMSRSRYRDQGRYLHGFASFLLKDYAAAEQSLSMVAPFQQPEFGGHARYLLARTHHRADEKAEAAHHYEGVVNDYAKSKAVAAELLKQPQKFNNDPVEKARLEAIVKDPASDHVGRASFYLGVLLYEGGKFAEAKTRFAEFGKLFPQSSLRNEAELRIGFCQVQLKEWTEAIKTLQPLIDKEARLSDQVLFWLGKAQAGAAPDKATNLPGYQQAIVTALATLRQAADRAQKMQEQDPDAKSRRGLVLLDIADTHQLIKQHKEAVSVYGQLLNEKLLTDRDEEIENRLVTALHLAGDFSESDKQAARFLEKYPKSSLAPAVLFTQAENSYFRGLLAEKNPNAAERVKEVARWNDDAIKRFTLVIDKFPEFPRINVARYSLGLSYYRQGQLEEARKALGAIPGPERGGELALVPYLMADCLLRQTPTAVPDDALAAAKMEDQLKSAAELLDGFAGGNATHPQAGDALIKLGLAHQRWAQLLTQPPEKAKALASAKAAYDRLLGKEFANHPLIPQAYLERAKVIAQGGNVQNAVDELRRFTNDPFAGSNIAPIAVIQMATFLRAQNKAPEAAAELAKARDRHEGPLSKDPDRAGWIALLRYHQGVALREAGKLPEARQLFDSVVKSSANRPEGAEAALRFAQCLKDEGQQRLVLARKIMANPQEQSQALKVQEEGYKSLREAVDYLVNQAESLKKSDTLQEVRARMLYEAAWALRVLAEPEIQGARTAIAVEMQKKLGPAAAKFPLPPVPLDKVPLQPSEKKARSLYQTMIDGFADAPLAVEARFELAELLADRNEYDLAVKLLNDALDKEPRQDLTEKVRLRLGAIHSAKGNLKAALGQFDAVAQNPKSPLVGWAHYRAGEAYLQNQQFGDAVKRLVIFRDNGAFQNIPGLSDRALLRLGHAYAYVKDWDGSRVSLERLVNTFPGSPWQEEARYAIGWALQNQNNPEGAVNAYGQVTARTATEIAAKAQFQIGLCRLEQKRYVDAANAFLVVPFTYDYPELSAAAMLEAAGAYVEANQKEQAIRLLQRLVRDYPDTPFADAAKDKLADKKLQ